MLPNNGNDNDIYKTANTLMQQRVVRTYPACWLERSQWRTQWRMITAPTPTTPAETPPPPLNFSVCLSRACLGKMITFSILKPAPRRVVFRTDTDHDNAPHCQRCGVHTSCENHQTAVFVSLQIWRKRKRKMFVKTNSGRIEGCGAERLVDWFPHQLSRSCRPARALHSMQNIYY